jgi:hypothetical protein
MVDLIIPMVWHGYLNGFFDLIFAISSRNPPPSLPTTQAGLLGKARRFISLLSSTQANLSSQPWQLQLRLSDGLLFLRT